MSKKIRFESIVFHFLTEVKRVAENCRSNTEYNNWKKFIDSLKFENVSKDLIKVSWGYPEINETVIDVSKAVLCFRGDNQEFIQKRRLFGMEKEKDAIKIENEKLFKQLVINVSELAKLK